jgi:hypothetical protein
MNMTLKIGLFVLATAMLSLSSCKKNFRSLSKFKVEEFNEFIDPARGNVLILSGDDLYFFKDTATGLVKLETPEGPKLDIALSPDAMKIAYRDTASNVFLLNVQGNANARKVSKMKGAIKIHWTKQGHLYGVNEKGQFLFNGSTYPVPNISVVYDTIRFMRDEFFDAVIMPDGKVTYSKHFEERDGLFTKVGDSLVVWNNADSTDVKFGYSGAQLPKRLQTDKEGNLVGYTGASAYLYDTEFGINGEILAGGEFDKYIVANSAHIGAAFVSGTKRELIIENKLVEQYPEYAVDDTLIFKGIISIDDFDIQIPEDEYPQQSFSFD